MTPTLRLRPDCLTAPSRRDLLLIEAYMLWPDDARARIEAVSAGMVKIAKSRTSSMPRTELLEYIDFATDSPPLASVRQGLEDRLQDGRLVGAILHHAVAFHVKGEQFTLAAIRRDVCEGNKRYGKQIGLDRGGQIAPKTIQNTILAALQICRSFLGGPFGGR